jgi:glycerate kinase
LKRLADVLEPLIGRRLRELPGVGAAGGTAFGLASALNATLNSGFHLIAQMIDLQEKIEESDLVISAEGRLDDQSLLGKGVGQLAKICQTQNRPLWLIPASASTDVDWSSYGIDRLQASSRGDRIACESDVTQTSEHIFAE